MKTYTKTIKNPRLVISHDQDSESPRKCDNLGYFITKENNYMSPDGNNNDFYDVMIEAESEAQDTASHIEAIKRIAIENEIDEKIIAIYPVYRYEHGNVMYKRGTASGFDVSNSGFYIVTDKTAELLGTPPERFEAVIDSELATYTKWANGEVYGFTLYDEDGVEEDSCWGFYDIEHIREALPEEWKDENLRDYLIN